MKAMGTVLFTVVAAGANTSVRWGQKLTVGK